VDTIRKRETNVNCQKVKGKTKREFVAKEKSGRGLPKNSVQEIRVKVTGREIRWRKKKRFQQKENRIYLQEG